MKDIALPMPIAYAEIGEEQSGRPILIAAHLKAEAIAGEHRRYPLFSADQMRAFYAEGVRAGMDRAEVICEELPTTHSDVDPLVEGIIQMDCVAAIRAGTPHK